MIWWNSNSDIIECVEIDGKWYALYGWNGEEYCDCWEVCDEVGGKFYESVGDKKYVIKPINNPVSIDEDGEVEEWETVGYEIRY